jgi:multidrug resistance efflux pump
MDPKDTQASTATSVATAREFIPNINTANEEIVRLDGSLAKASGDLKKAQDDLKAANDLLEAAPKPEALQAAADAQKKAEDALTKANADHAKALKDLQAQVDEAKNNGVKAAAAAGVAPVVDAKTTGVDAQDDKNKHSNLTGLARAIAGNQELQASKSGK